MSGGGGVLVHCVAGVSRSVTMTCAFLIREHLMDAYSALDMVRSARKHAYPNNGFFEQLQFYESLHSQKVLNKEADKLEQFYRELNLKVDSKFPTKCSFELL